VRDDEHFKVNAAGDVPVRSCARAMRGTAYAAQCANCSNEIPDCSAIW
jgi:hypothetical protein